MFKKTLLALAVAGASMSVNAGILSVDVKETAAVKTDFDAAAPATCAAAATALGVSLDLATFKDTAGADTVKASVNGGTAGVYDTTANAVTLDADDSCTVTINKDELVSADQAKYSQEGAAAKGLTITGKHIAGVGGLQVEDTIIYTVTGGTINETASAGATLTSATGTYTLLGVVDNTILFTVDAGAAAREIVNVAGVVVTPTAGADSVSLSAVVQNTANVQYDKSPAIEITKIAKQYSAKTYLAADGVIDVATERYDFEANTSDSSATALPAIDGVNADSLVIEVTENTTQGNLTPKSGELVITGNFSWMMDLDADEDGELSATEIESGFDYGTFTAVDVAPNAGKLITAGTNVVDAGKSALNTDMTELTIPVVAGADADLNKYHVVTFKPAGKATATVSLETTKFIASLDFINDKTADTTTADADLNVTTDLAVGEWTLNGSVVEVPYIPFGPETQPIIRHTNTGAQTGDISVRYMVEEGNGLMQTNTWKSLGVLVQDAKPGVRNLLTDIKTALEAELGQNKFKVALEITTNVPGDDVTVYAAAKVNAEGQDRLTIGAFKGQ
ncbi:MULTISPECIES: hypothetical protein [unclassified Pseudoalteromonas]|uniref:hypothetical protein n=1 Tax=unclassified Pseudoalteromonas TaxID=194690 RepID=UPI00390C7948